ncbi:MAG: hypothetical protein C0467_19620 [Planctomycetaceae bacterium]|nr:hypothetical protein [Planctomycetaceae bacterium]
MSVARLGSAIGLVFVLGVVTGCGGGGSDLGDLSGAVTYDGKPVEDGAISFIPVDGKSPTAGGTIKDGKYTATKVPVGATKVSITAVKVIGKKKAYDTPDSPEIPITEPLVPAKYNQTTELRYDVKGGVQTKDFQLAK